MFNITKVDKNAKDKRLLEKNSIAIVAHRSEDEIQLYNQALEKYFNEQGEDGQDDLLAAASYMYIYIGLFENSILPHIKTIIGLDKKSEVPKAIKELERIIKKAKL